MICENPPSVMPMLRSRKARSLEDKRSNEAIATVPASPRSLPSSTNSSMAQPSPRCSRSISTFCSRSRAVA
eukprot:Skav206766  [mRNA]  locus=scaffold167:448903:453458:- [translate_table: standard]